MNEQIVILFFIIAGLAVTLFLYIWKAKKQIEYRGDERWLFIQNKANNAANCVNYILILLVAVGEGIMLFSGTQDTQITLTLTRVSIYCMLFVALRNAIELFSLKYFDKHM